MTRRARIARSLEDLNPLGLIALVVILFAAAMVVLISRPLWSVFSHRTVAAVTPRDPDKAEREFESAADQYLARVEGRSLFVVPSPPRADTAHDRGPKPTVYGGPSLLAFVNGSAWFSDGQKISESEPKGKTLKLVKADPPWSVRVEWEGAEFDVELFKRTTLSNLAETRSVPLSSIPSRSTNGGRSTGAAGSRPSSAAPPSGSTAASAGSGASSPQGGPQGGPSGAPPGMSGGPPGAPPPPDASGPRPPGAPPQSADPRPSGGGEPGTSPAPSPAPAPSDPVPEPPASPPAPPSNPDTLR